MSQANALALRQNAAADRATEMILFIVLVIDNGAAMAKGAGKNGDYGDSVALVDGAGG